MRDVLLFFSFSPAVTLSIDSGAVMDVFHSCTNSYSSESSSGTGGSPARAFGV